MSNQTLVGMILKVVEAAIEQQCGKAPDQAFRQVLGNSIGNAVVDYRQQAGSSTSYESALGGFIIEQNPYSRWENLVFPNLPLNPDGENMWVRKSGVLAGYNAHHPLPGGQPIPGGQVVNFSYANWKYLADPEEPTGYRNPAGVGSGTEHEAIELPEKPEPIPKPDADPVRSDEYPPNDSFYYGHNIVKSVRLKYKFVDRRYGYQEAREKRRERDTHTGYILILYSGNDH